MMKKVFLFIAIAALSISCSNDDDAKRANGGTISVTVDGVAKTYSNVAVAAQDYPAANGEPAYTELRIVGSNGQTGVNAETILIEVDKGDEGANAVWDVTFTKDNTVYNSNQTLVSNVTKNNNNGELKGTFSGTLEFSIGMIVPPVVITDGSFDIQY